ncbi:MAG: hypothetical protein WCT27_00255 [Patescibacteria group bacterium]|jgi:hypothetical protein
MEVLMPDKTPNKVSVSPLSGGNGWCIKINGTPFKSLVTVHEPVITKSDHQGVTYEHEGQEYTISWPD